VEPPHTYVRDAAAVVHHRDYLDSRDDRALCGGALTDAVTLTAHPSVVCAACEARLVEYHLVWWRTTALAALAELDELRTGRGASAADDPSVEHSGSAPSEDPPSGPVGAEPASLLDHARTELLNLCRQFDGAVPYRRVKTVMQAFSDNLDADERVALAQQIGNDGSLLRWSTVEAETLGWHVTDNPVQAETEEMWDAWTRDAYQTPKPGKWRLGRSRSR
jgi:hypothetical protein